MRHLDAEDLHILADRPSPTHPIPAAGGVAFYVGRDHGVPEGAIITAGRARQLGAQLILAADEWDAIVDHEDEHRRHP